MFVVLVHTAGQLGPGQRIASGALGGIERRFRLVGVAPPELGDPCLRDASHLHPHGEA
jgi:hypothetical protein